eukprot:CAMPEP_0206493592 /NCGR_PEP_ID=MMETSP0324_2-20121206/47109_1 /ASSEMBLY_ACC=CAM_ASM_000836 /TAXON_ID=2866 /ORGANISM="Crypthecodinium cohnii, Strain Seligo" /LENGTH=80 /DNA_ID=CAMNT_0053976855 /DNA_START=162 /DNA_END=401 /DNA_ORIENTATION=-
MVTQGGTAWLWVRSRWKRRDGWMDGCKRVAGIEPEQESSWMCCTANGREATLEMKPERSALGQPNGNNDHDDDDDDDADG